MIALVDQTYVLHIYKDYSLLPTLTKVTLAHARFGRRDQAILECLLITAVSSVVLAALAYHRGYMDWSWDAINHHIYLGLIAESPRWRLDISAAASQTYQYPYLYWPVYKLSLMSGSGALAGALWAAAQTALVMPPVWLFSYRVLPDSETVWLSRFYRAIACALALLSLPVLAAVGTTANDVLAGVPLLWAISLGIKFPVSERAALISAMLLGIAIAFKYSNVLFLPFLIFVWWQPHSPRVPLRLGFRIAFCSVAGFALAYAPWGWQLWRETGNPFYPHLAAFFAT